MPTDPPHFHFTSLIGGRPVPPGPSTFRSFSPAQQRELEGDFSAAEPHDVAIACARAATASCDFAATTGSVRAGLLNLVAAEILALGDELVQAAVLETGLTPARITSERDRTCAQLRLYGGFAARCEWVDATIDEADPARNPVARPDLRRMNRPVGPVAVFGASNFPLAYSTAGGDTASALAVGCPVIVKGHPSHPRTGSMVALAISRAVQSCGLDAGVFSFLLSGGAREQAVGTQLVTHPAIRAVGFTGSLRGGMALHALASARPCPIPVFAEMGSTNPVLVLQSALAQHSAEIAAKLAASITASGGQMCTCPGIIAVEDGPLAGAFIADLAQKTAAAAAGPMLSPRVAHGFIDRSAAVLGTPSVSIVRGNPSGPFIAKCSAQTFFASPALHEEVFGPAAVVVECATDIDMHRVLDALGGTLTATVWAQHTHTEVNDPALRALLDHAQRIAGRVIFNGVPTGVEVAPAMVHGGPFPATNQPQSSAVGSLALARWCRPVCFQNVPDPLLPPELQAHNPLRLHRTVNGEPRPSDP